MRSVHGFSQYCSQAGDIHAGRATYYVFATHFSSIINQFHPDLAVVIQSVVVYTYVQVAWTLRLVD